MSHPGPAGRGRLTSHHSIGCAAGVCSRLTDAVRAASAEAALSTRPHGQGRHAAQASTGCEGGAEMKAIVVTDQAAGTAGMTVAERPEPDATTNDVLVEVHASGFTPGELTWP